MVSLFSRRRKDIASSDPHATAATAGGGTPEPLADTSGTAAHVEGGERIEHTDPQLFEKAREHWAAQIGELSDFSTLTDLTQLEGAIVDITHAHPSGLAQLYAGRATRLSSLVREPSAHALARETARAVLARAAEFAERFGAAPVYLALGVGEWAEIGTDGEVRLVTAPLLLRPLNLREISENDLELTLTPGIEINPEFVAALRSTGAEQDLDSLTAMSVMTDGFSPRSTLSQLSELGAGHLSGFEMSEKLYVGPFVHPGKALQDDLEGLSENWSDHHIVRALAGDLEVKRHLAVELPEMQATDRAPDAERGVGDLDPTQQAILDHVVAGYDLILDARPGSDVPVMVTAILADAAASGRTVVYLAGTRRAGRAVVGELYDRGLESLVLDLQDPHWRSRAPGILRRSLQPSPDTVDEDAVRSLRRELHGVRARLEEYTRALHERRESWDLTAYDALQGLADLTSGADAPRTAVRFDEETTRRATPERRQEAIAKLEQLARLGAFTLRPGDTPWFGTHLADAAAVTGVLEATQTLGDDVLPQVIGDVGRVARETGLERAVSLADWCEQIEMLNGIRESLDTFIPVIFERSPAEMVIATATPAWRKERDISMSWSDRRRLTKQARDMVRPGRTADDLHSALDTIRMQREVWRRHCPGGGWPHLPQGLGDLERTANAARDWMSLLDGAFDENLMDLPLEELRERLLALGADPSALRFIPEINAISAELREMGFGALVRDLAERRVEESQIRKEVELAWWASVLESIVRSDSNLAQYDSATLNAVASSFREHDRSQVATLPGPVRRAVSKRLARTVHADKGQAQALWRELAQGHGADVKSLRARYRALVTAARPIWIIPALQAGQVLPPVRDIDLLVIDGAQNVPTGALVGTISRAKQLVLVGDLSRRSSGVVEELSGTVPAVELPTNRGQREEHIASFLAGHGYGTLGTIPARPSPSRIRLHLVDGVGTPMIGSVSVEGVDAEVERVLELAREHSAAGESVGIVSLSAIAARRIAQAVESDPRLAGLDIPVVDVEDAAGLSRETVILSVGFAKTPHGRVLHRFGPISSPEGASLLIDALDSVRHNLDVVSCISPDDLDGERLTHAGAKLLDALLDFASDSPAGPGSSKARSEPSAGQADRLLEDLSRRLRERGLTVAPQFGFEGGVRIPLAVGHPRCDGELVVAVFTDNAEYVAEPSLRQRDRLWVERLARHGWDVHMAFSTAVFMDPVGEADAIEAKVRAHIPVAEPQRVAKPQPKAEVVPVEAPPAPAKDGDGSDFYEGVALAEIEGHAFFHEGGATEPPTDHSGAVSETSAHAGEAADEEANVQPDSASGDAPAAIDDHADADEVEPIQESLFPPAIPQRDIRSYSDDELDEISSQCVQEGMDEDALVEAMRDALGVTKRGKRVDSMLHKAASRRLAE